MADPARRPDYETPRPPQDPFNPIPAADPAVPPEPLDLDQPNVVIEERSGLSAANIVLIAAIVLVLGAVGFYIFGSGAPGSSPTAQAPAPAATDTTTTSSTKPPADTGGGGNTAAPADKAAPAAPKPVEPAPAPAQ
jgi:hypothetical protein